jgi:hypothetical protein
VRPLPPHLPDVPEVHPASFRTTVTLALSDVSSMITALDQLSRECATWPPGIARSVRAAAGELCSTPSPRADSDTGDGGVLLECPKERALDVAAMLLDAATGLQRAGCHLAAFALEGVEGRLLEALVTDDG